MGKMQLSSNDTDYSALGKGASQTSFYKEPSSSGTVYPSYLQVSNINYPLDTSQMNYWLTECADILPDKIVRDLDSQRYELDHLSQKFLMASVPIIATHFFSNDIITDTEYSKALTESLRKHVTTILEKLSFVKTELDSMASNPMDRSGGSAAP
jgi:hypothetical protein